MRRKTLFILIIIAVVVVIISAGGLIYYKRSHNFKTINIQDVKLVALHPFQGAGATKKAYTYDTENSNDVKIINHIINDLNTAEFVRFSSGLPVSNGGSLEHLDIELTSGEHIELIGSTNGQVFVSLRNTNKTYILYSPELSKLFADELQRIFNS